MDLVIIGVVLFLLSGVGFWAGISRGQLRKIIVMGISLNVWLWPSLLIVAFSIPRETDELSASWIGAWVIVSTVLALPALSCGLGMIFRLLIKHHQKRTSNVQPIIA